MTTCQLITIDFDEEMAATRKLLERIPLDDEHRGFKPHPKSMALDRLATHVAELPSWIEFGLDQDVFDLDPEHEFTVARSTAELLETFDRCVEKGRAAIDRASDEAMQKEWTFKYGGQTIFTEVRTKLFRSFLNHLVHHRAQLGVYLRLNGIPVPGMYGPSADEHVMAAAS
jgi:uncharacterized damage-inducible protein DinB